MKLVEGTAAKSINTTDVFGNPVHLSTSGGKRMLLSFLRFTGCPICNLHVHEWLQRKAEIDDANLQIVVFLESTAETTRTYVEREELPFTFVSDPEKEYYKLYGVETSWTQYILMWFSISMWARSIKGWSLYSAWSSMKGTPNRVEAEFLIGDGDKILKAHYGSRIGDYMPFEEYLVSC
jgi:peroxiredoxin